LRKLRHRPPAETEVYYADGADKLNHQLAGCRAVGEGSPVRELVAPDCAVLGREFRNTWLTLINVARSRGRRSGEDLERGASGANRRARTSTEPGRQKECEGSRWVYFGEVGQRSQTVPVKCVQACSIMYKGLGISQKLVNRAGLTSATTCKGGGGGSGGGELLQHV